MNIYFGENLKKFRIESKLTQEALASHLGVSFQAVSKWERGDSYPDITLLPVIAHFFNKTIDELIGFNEAVNETEIKKILDEFDCHTNPEKKQILIKQALKEYPNDFRIIIRHFHCLIAYSNDTIGILKEAHDIYNHIQQHCTVDSIRIRAKRIMAQYYQSLSRIENSGFKMEDAKKIIDELPPMRDGRDYYATLFHYLNPDEHKQACREAIEEELILLDNTISHLIFYESGHWEKMPQFKDLAYKINAIEIMNDIYNMLYTDGNYGQNWRFVIYNYGELGYLYFLSDDFESAIKNLKICAELAKQFDNLPQITSHTSMIFDGMEFNKSTLGSTYDACSHIKRLMLENYPLSDDFKSSAEFKEIIEILNS